MIRLKRKLDIIFPGPTVCKFHAVCSGYRKEAHTCQHDDEAKGYCGLYSKHEAAILQGQMKHMLDGTEFGDFDI